MRSRQPHILYVHVTYAIHIDIVRSPCSDKLVVSQRAGSAAKPRRANPGCPDGCVFDLSSDPGEHHDLSQSLPQVKKQLLAAAEEAKKTAFQTNETPGYTNCENASSVQERNHGFVGIVCTKDEL